MVFVFGIFPLFLGSRAAMGFARTITIIVGRKLNGQEEKSRAIMDFFAPLQVESVQFCFELVRVSFKTDDMKTRALQLKGFHIFGMWVKIEGVVPLLLTYIYSTTRSRLMKLWLLLRSPCMGKFKRSVHSATHLIQTCSLELVSYVWFCRVPPQGVFMPTLVSWPTINLSHL